MQLARWAHMHRFLSVCSLDLTKKGENNSYLRKYIHLFLPVTDYTLRMISVIIYELGAIELQRTLVIAVTGRAHCQCQVVFFFQSCIISVVYLRGRAHII